MQRILSVETSRNPNTSTEYVSKRLCFSILFSIAFLFLLAGYLLGRYTTDKSILLKKAYMIQKLSLDEKNPMEIVRNISISVRNINNATTSILTEFYNVTEIYETLKCPHYKDGLPTFREFEKDVSLKISKMLTAHLENMGKCFTSIDNLLRNISSSFNN